MNDRMELCLFLSSTFLDMMPEREYLVKHLLPELRQLCRERGVILTEIDLRWGITERQARRGKIVSVCLEEILRRRPLILAFIGDRYGWRPTPGDLNDTAFLGRFPWVEKGVNEGKSLVELETLEVARNDPAMRERIRFYFKRKNYAPLRRKAEGEQGGDAAAELLLLNGFHDRVQDAGLPMREGYRTPAQLAEWVREDVLAILNAIAPDGAGLDSWIARERYGHEAYAATRRRAYIDHAPTLQALDRYVESLQRQEGSENRFGRVSPLVVTGESGAGKSALLARWSERYRAQNPDAFLIEHYVGATPSGADRFALMRRIMAEIRERYGLAEELPALPEQIVETFPSWLARVREEKLVLVIDALDRLDNAVLSLDSFPLDYAPQIRLLLSTTPGPILDQARERGWEFLQVHPLAETDRRKAIRAYLAEFSKRLEPEQVRRIATDGKSANPLYLRTSLEELRIHGEHETLNGKIDHYLSAADPQSLFALVLERIENDFGKGLTAAAMSCLWASRSGLSEFELAGLLNAPPLKLRPLIGGMEHHLTRIDGLLNFCHDHLRRAVAERYLPSRVRRRNFHRRIAAWFADQSVSSRRAEEEPWQWQQGEAPERLLGCLTDMELFPLLNNERMKFQLLEYWRTGGISLQLKDAYMTALTELENRPEVVELWCEVGEFLMMAGYYEGAAQFFRKATKRFKKLRAPVTARLLDGLGSALTEVGRFKEADSYLQESLSLKQSMFHEESLEVADTLERIGALLYQVQRFSEAEKILERSLEIRRHSLGLANLTTINSIGAVAAACYGRRKFDKAERLFLLQLEYMHNLLGDASSEKATCLNNLAAVMSQLGKYDVSCQYFEQALQIYEKIFGPNHPNTAKALSNLSYTLLYLDKTDESEAALRRAIKVDRLTLGSEHPTIASKLISFGTLLRECGKPLEAEQAYREALEIRNACFGPDHIATTTAYINVAGALKEQGRFEEAFNIYQEYLPKKIAGLDSEDAGLQRSIKQYEELIELLKIVEEV